MLLKHLSYLWKKKRHYLIALFMGLTLETNTSFEQNYNLQGVRVNCLAPGPIFSQTASDNYAKVSNEILEYTFSLNKCIIFCVFP